MLESKWYPQTVGAQARSCEKGGCCGGGGAFGTVGVGIGVHSCSAGKRVDKRWKTTHGSRMEEGEPTRTKKPMRTHKNIVTRRAGSMTPLPNPSFKSKAGTGPTAPNQQDNR